MFEGNFIGGAWRPAASGAVDEVLAPATGEVLAKVPSSDKADVDAAVAAAATAFETWGLVTPRERAERLLALADAVEANLDELKRLEMDNVGKPASIIDFEFDLTVDNLRFFAGAARCLGTQAAGEYLEDHTSMLRRDPLGVCVGIAPWNYPLNMAVWKLGPALAAGNTFVLKPSELTPLTALKLAEIAADIFPPGVFNVLCGQGETAGDALVRHPDVAMLSLTGDVNTGKLIARNAADTLKRVHLELGGKAPVVVFDDADLDAVVATLAETGYYNSGQDCTAPCRVIAGPGIYDDLVGNLADAVSSLATGDPSDPDTEVGPVDLRRAAHARGGHGRPRRRRRCRGRGGRTGARSCGLLLRAHGRRRSEAGQRDRAARGVRPGRVGPARHRRGAGREVGQRRRLRPGRRASGPATSAGPCA